MLSLRTLRYDLNVCCTENSNDQELQYSFFVFILSLTCRGPGNIKTAEPLCLLCCIVLYSASSHCLKGVDQAIGIGVEDILKQIVSRATVSPKEPGEVFLLQREYSYMHNPFIFTRGREREREIARGVHTVW